MTFKEQLYLKKIDGMTATQLNLSQMNIAEDVVRISKSLENEQVGFGDIGDLGEDKCQCKNCEITLEQAVEKLANELKNDISLYKDYEDAFSKLARRGIENIKERVIDLGIEDTEVLISTEIASVILKGFIKDVENNK